MLANFHFEDKLPVIIKADNNSEVDLNEGSILSHFKMISPLEIVTFIWVFALIVEELKQVV